MVGISLPEIQLIFLRKFVLTKGFTLVMNGVKFSDIVDVWLFRYDGPVSLEMATTNEVAQSAWLDKGQIKELFDNGEFVDTLGYFFEEKELGGE